ncbi:unnamed protein product [Didymodactylos carnosus]|uniref:N-acetyltransferase domain-containing protein n=1 Tax=Didymodactylos carnosus TaxID=1234261 RepID=A0A815V4P0_9BILA|nr:unnamed protein product [Didymodactylos carnosus]CAF1565168.1 unnamed protein product [Didymodactylos carnosus]CAF4358081.1 unnamed protein product [Didymodactylos carnosus]CAF4386586.1 unnamed protein product [Didymodactylos carnosus]
MEIRENSTIEDAILVHSQIDEFDQHNNLTDYFLHRLNGKQHLILVAYTNEAIPVGYLVCYDRYNDNVSFYIWLAGVLEQYRHQNILKQLMTYAERWIKQNGFTKAVIKTRNQFKNMILYLVKYDYKFIEIEKKADIKDNRLILEKLL